ncbi:hypothetical protein LCGC14_2577290, partial [marine sediment metagenome]
QDGQSNANLGVYSRTLEFNGDIEQEFFIYEARSVTHAEPPTADPEQIFTPYYFVFEVQHMLDLMNNAYALAFSNINPKPATIGGVPPEAPYIIYNSETRLLSIITQRAYYDLALADPIKIYFNNSTFSLMPAYPVERLSLSQERDFLLLVRNYRNNFFQPSDLINTFPDPPDFFEMKESYITINQWYAGKKIILLSDDLPVRSEFIEESVTGVQGNIDTFRSVVTDFSPSAQGSDDYRGILQLTPNPQYRLVDLLSDRPIYKINIKVFFEDKLGNLFQLFLEPFQTMTIKIGFLNKELYKNLSRQNILLLQKINENMEKSVKLQIDQMVNLMN